MRFSVRYAWLSFGGLSLFAVVTGCWVARAHGVSVRVWLTNLAAWVVGAGLAFAVSRTRRTRVWQILAVVGLACTFLSSGMSGVHRWIAFGPIRLNGAELLLPPFLVGRFTLLLSLLVLIMLVLQPDVSQAFAFAGATIVMTAMSGALRIERVLTIALFASVAMLAFLRLDPLAPVPEVEGIIGLAAGISPVLAALATLSLAGTVLVPLTVARSPSAYALTTYLAICALAPAFGAFPVPLVGMGISPILGTWLGFGALMELAPTQRLRPS